MLLPAVTERRKLTRFVVSAPVRVILRRGEATTDYDAKARDVSVAGAFIYFTDPEARVGDHVSVEIRLTISDQSSEEASSVEVPTFGSGEICRVESDGIALTFDGELSFA